MSGLAWKDNPWVWVVTFERVDDERPDVKHRPILFSAPMVRAILADTKTQTRRVIRPQPGPELGETPGAAWDAGFVDVPCPYGIAGERLWVRETFAPRYFDNGRPGYRADWNGESADCVPEPKWKPSIFMRRHESRITLEVTDVRVERLQDISSADAIAEGIAGPHDVGYPAFRGPGDSKPRYSTAVAAYEALWDSINGRRSA